MFEQVTILLSFVFAVALTQLLTSATELVWARDRVRVSWLQVLWMFNALIGLIIGWVGMFYLSKRPSWDTAEILINFAGAVLQYFSCSLLSIRPKDEGIVDMPAFFERQRPYVMSAFVAMMFMGMFENWWDRNLLSDPNTWLAADYIVIPMAIFSAMGFAPQRWLQWLGGAGLAVIQTYFLFANFG